MLKPAQLYRDRLQEEIIKTWYDLENIYWNNETGSSIVYLEENNINRHQFVSVDKYDNIIGYLTYYIDWSAMSAEHFGIISFNKGNYIFIKDIYTAVCDLFNKYNMNRILWYCYTDNPAIKGYRKFIKEYGGCECGYFRQNAKLQDGQLHDSIAFEILASEFKGGKRK